MQNKEIDKLVAEKVMKWEWVENTDGLRNIIPYKWKTDTGYRSSFSPSFDIEDAWKVVEKLKQEEQFFFNLVNGDLRDYECDFDGYSAEADTAPMAICLAALKAYRIEY